MWEEPEEYTAVSHYNITIFGFDLNRCIEQWFDNAILNELQYNVEVELEPYALILVFVFAETDMGVSGSYDKFVSSEAESTPPENFTVTAITNTSASFQWSHPLDANGIISAYHIIVSDGAAYMEMITTISLEKCHCN
jgi:hypothetical protein